jgi:uncharacterized phage protein (TIGR01671 family)
MMREIKFRAVRLSDGQVFLPIAIYQTGDEPVVEWISATGPSQLSDMPGNGVVLMQYTGLRDKNGREIYEGDILRVDWNDARYLVHNIGPVIWDDDNACWQLGEGGSPKSDSRQCMEVIGNIYENPELLQCHDS